MIQWNFYFSGILYGKIQEENQQLTLQQRIFESGEWSERIPFTEKEDEEFSGLCGRSILGFFRRKKEYETEIAAKHEVFTTESQEIFTKRREDSYIQRSKKFPMDLFYDEEGIYSVLMSGRDFTAVLVKKGMEKRTVLSRWEEVYPGESETDGEFQPGMVYPVDFIGSFRVPTRDGEQLATYVYLPKSTEKAEFPTVLVRTPYGRGRGKEQYFRFVQRGYALVIQDTRGREDSTGEWMPEYYEIEDGDDTLNWIAAQDFSDGQVSMTGGSYLGYVQWAAAASGNPHLKAMLSSVCAGSAFVDIPRRGGCFNSGMLAWAFAMSEQKMRPDLMAQENWDEILDIRPLEDIPRKALGHEVPFITKWLSHMDMDDFWKHGNWFERYQGNPVPALIMSGWFDDNGMGTTEALDLVKTWPKGTWKAVLGPWKHSGNADYDLHGVSLGEDALRYDMDILCMMWLEHFLKGVENGIENTSTVEYYTVGENQWKQAATWPVENVTRTMYYLDGEGNNLADGVISAKYRNGFEIPEYMEPGKIYEINIRTTKISNTFLPGHRMRVTITSSAKNFIFPNSNTENGFNSEKRQKAHITVHRGGKYTSGILIPVENK